MPFELITPAAHFSQENPEKSAELVPFTCFLCHLISYDPVGWLDTKQPICEFCALALEAQRGIA